MSFNTPILFLVFNRPDTTRKVFERIREIKPQKLFFAADGPREGIEGEKEKCEEVRNIVMKGIDWPCEVITLFRDKNLGCGVAPSQAITWFFEHVEEGIILEDDIVPSQSFFYFTKALLSLYRNDESVWNISGNSFNPYKMKLTFYFSAYPHIWGWATWKRAWINYRFDLDDIDQKILFENIDQLFSTSSERSFWKEIFINYLKKKDLSVWDYQWTFRLWYNKKLSIVPKVNLITNIGFDKDATHTINKNSWMANLKASEIEIPQNKEPVKQNKKADLNTSRKVFEIKSKTQTIINDFKKAIKKTIKQKILKLSS